MKKLLSVFLFCALGVFCFAQSAPSLDDAIRNSIVYFRGRLAPGSRLAVAAVQGNTPELSRYLGQKISAALVNDGYFTVVERDDTALSSLSREMNYQLSGEVSDETSLSIGRQLGAEIILSGAINPSGQGYRLELKALRVESAQVAAQWSAENIRADASWEALARPSRSAALSFAGDEIPARERQAFADALGRALETHRVPLELDLSPAGGAGGNGYTFALNFYSEYLPSAPPANTAFLSGEFTVSLLQGSRALRRAGPYRVTETTLPLLVRRGAEELQKDGEFFTALKKDLDQ